jgi:hypothetical protein
MSRITSQIQVESAVGGAICGMGDAAITPLLFADCVEPGWKKSCVIGGVAVPSTVGFIGDSGGLARIVKLLARRIGIPQTCQARNIIAGSLPLGGRGQYRE